MPNDATLGVPERPVTALHFTIEVTGEAERLADLDADRLRRVLARLRQAVAALRRVHGCEGFNLYVNDRRHGKQSIGEVPEPDHRVRFHILGRRGDEPVAPTTILNAPEDFPLEPISSTERTARLRRLTEPPSDPAAPAPTAPAPTALAPTALAPTALAPAGRDTATEGSTEPSCSICTSDQVELVRGDAVRVIRPPRPLIPAHVLLTPRRHVEHLLELSDDEFVELFRIFDRVADTFGQIDGSSSFNLFANDGKAAGQHVSHLHMHVFGRSDHEETDPYQLLRGLRFNLRH